MRQERGSEAGARLVTAARLAPADPLCRRRTLLWLHGGLHAVTASSNVARRPRFAALAAFSVAALCVFTLHGDDAAPAEAGDAAVAAAFSAAEARFFPRPSEPPAAGITVSYDAETEQYKSQEGQDKWADEHVFRRRRRGVFVDLGCYDGITYSNSWYFERVLGWAGVCAEPNPDVFPRIASQAGRESGVQVAVSGAAGKLPFVTAFMRSSLNASAVDYDFLASQGVGAGEALVDVVTPGALLDAHLPAGTRVVDYVNIDVEGAELAVLKVWPFDRYCVDVFNIENEPAHGAPSTLPALRALLEPHGYAHRVRVGVDEIFTREPACARDAPLRPVSPAEVEAAAVATATARRRPRRQTAARGATRGVADSDIRTLHVAALAQNGDSTSSRTRTRV